MMNNVTHSNTAKAAQIAGLNAGCNARAFHIMKSNDTCKGTCTCGLVATDNCGTRIMGNHAVLQPAHRDLHINGCLEEVPLDPGLLAQAKQYTGNGTKDINLSTMQTCQPAVKLVVGIAAL